MKRILSITIIAFSMLAVGSLKNTASAQPYEDDLSYQDFYDELDPYGTWMDYPEYGYVWRPNLGADFRPYSTNGRWVWSDEYEWIWVSNYSWGWAPFHYGRWFYDSFYGWMWVPGYEWSPAWVAWRHGGDYYGWAPIRPGINISIGFSLGSYNPPIDYWCFAPRRYIVSPRLYDYCVPYTNNVTIINQTTIINNYNYNRNVFRTGPGRRDVERYAGRITSTRLRDVNSSRRAGFRNNEVSVYRPRIRENNDNRNIAPRRFERYEREGRNEGNASVTRRNGNNLPARRFDADERAGSARPGNNNAISNRGNDRFERNNNDNRNERMNRPSERPRVNQPPQGNNNPGNRNNENPANNDRRIGQPFERNNNTERQNNNRVERPAPVERNNNNNNRVERPRPSERNNNSEEQRGRMEQRNNSVNRPQQAPRQMNPNRAPSQPRQFENRAGNGNRSNNSFRQQGGNTRSGDNGSRQSRRR